jgi:hypothetical protein
MGEGRVRVSTPGRGGHRDPLHCRFVLTLMHFILDSLTYSVTLFLKRQCELALGADGS